MALAVPVSAGGSGAVAAGALTEAVSTMNSLVDGRLDQISWTLTAPSMAPAVRSIFANTGHTGERKYLWINYDQLCPEDGYRERPFTVPAGVTQVRIELDDVILPTGVGSSPAFYLQLYDATGITQVHSQAFTPTSTRTNVATSSITVTPGIEYLVRVACNVDGQATFVCGRLRVRPVTSSDSFWTTPFRRIDADHSVIQDSNETGYANPRFPQQSEFAHIDVLTNARTLRVEYYQNVEDFIGERGSPSVFVDGDPIDPPLSTTTGAIAYPEVTIPTSSKRARHITVYAGAQAATGLPAPALENRGTFVCGIYLPASAQVEVLPERQSGSADTYVIYGDSKAAGFYSSSVGRDSLTFVLRRKGVRVISQTAGGASIFSDVGSTLTVAACTPLARKLCRKNPQVIVLEMGRNDFANQRYTPANLVTQIGNLLDAINQVSPRVRVLLMTFTHEDADEETDVAGTSWDAERAAIAALATSRAWVTVVDAARYWTVAEANSYTTDGVHPNDAGQERIARGILGEEYPWSPLQIASLDSWFEGGVNMTGGAAGTVSKSGTGTVPDITFTGTPVKACRLRFENKVAGSGGGASPAARGRWTIDDGRSWPGKDIPLTATVDLAPLGLTANCAVGTYPNNAVYISDMTCTQWTSKKGSRSASQAVSGRKPSFSPLAPNGPGLVFNSVNVQRLEITGMNIPQPFAIYAVAKCNSQASLKAVFGSPSAGAAPSLYANTGTTMALNFGTQFQVTVNATLIHCYIAIVNGASSVLRVDGTATTGSLGSNSMTDLLIGGGVNPSAGFWDQYINELMIFTGIPSTDECMALEARSRDKWGTP